VRLKPGNVILIDRESKYPLYYQDLVTFEEGAVAYDQRDAAGFIKLNALRLRTLGQRRKKLGL
jgi:argininosuccinate synthase